MYLADYHTHTQFSPDAHDPMADMARAAIRAGLDEICFTDHVEPMEWQSTELRKPYNWPALTEDFAAAQAAVGHQIQLRLGMELGDAQWAPEHVAKLLEGAPEFDFIIGSIHLLSRKYGGADLYDYAPATAAEAQEALGDYLEEALDLAKLGALLNRQEEEVEEKKTCRTLLIVLAVIGAVAAVAGIAYAVYRFVTPDYLDDYDDDFDDDFEEDEEDEEPVVVPAAQEEKAEEPAEAEAEEAEKTEE